MALSDFYEYLDSKGAMQDTPKVKVVADEVDVPENRKKQPPKGMGMIGNKQPYTKDGKGIATSGQKEGFGDMGDKSLIYDTSKSPKPATLPTAESFDLVYKIRDAIRENPRILESLVNELNKSGLLGSLVGEMVEYRETFQHLSDVMGHKKYGPVVCDRLARALREDVAPPFGQQGQDDLGMGGGEGDPSLDDPNAMGGDEPPPEDGAPTCPHCGGDLSAMMDGGAGADLMGGDEPPPEDGALPDDQSGMGGMDGMPPQRPKHPMMGNPMENLRHSFRKTFV